MNSIFAIYYLEPLITILALSAATALLMGFRPYEWMVEQFQLPRKPLLCPKCFAFWLTLAWCYQEPWKIQFVMAIFASILAEIIDQKINLKYE